MGRVIVQKVGFFSRPNQRPFTITILFRSRKKFGKYKRFDAETFSSWRSRMEAIKELESWMRRFNAGFEK